MSPCAAAEEEEEEVRNTNGPYMRLEVPVAAQGLI